MYSIKIYFKQDKSSFSEQRFFFSLSLSFFQTAAYVGMETCFFFFMQLERFAAGSVIDSGRLAFVTTVSTRPFVWYPTPSPAPENLHPARRGERTFYYDLGHARPRHLGDHQSVQGHRNDFLFSRAKCATPNTSYFTVFRFSNVGFATVFVFWFFFSIIIFNRLRVTRLMRSFMKHCY